MRGGALGVRSVRHSVETDRSAQQSTDFDNLVKSHYAVVYNLAYRVLRRREDAEDVAQQTFARALPRLGDLRQPAAAGRWLCRITANICIDELRRRSSQGYAAEIDEAALNDLADEDVLRIPMAAAELHETRLRVWRAALALPPRQRLALALRESHQMSYAEIAAAMGTISVAAVETLLFRARAGFRLAYTGRKPPGPRGAECEWITERLSASIDFELSHRDALRIDVHLPHCDACRFVSQELRATSRLYALLPLIAPLPGAEAAVLIAVSSAGAGLSGALAMGAGGGLSAGLGTGVANAGVGMATMVVTLVTAGFVWTGDATPGVSDAGVRTAQVTMRASTQLAATPSVVEALARTTPQAQDVLALPTPSTEPGTPPTTEPRTRPAVDVASQLRASPVASSSSASPPPSPSAVPSGRVESAPVLITPAVAPVLAARDSGRSPVTPDESTAAAAPGRGAGHHDVKATSSTPDTPKTDQPGESRRPPSQNGSAERSARKAADTDPADIQPARASPRPAATKAGADPQHGAQSPASEASAAQRTATGPGGSRSSDAGSATSSHGPTQPPPASPAPEPRRTAPPAAPGLASPVATTPQPHSEASAAPSHQKRG